MTCCNNQNSGCKQREAKNFETTDAPVESLLDSKDIVNLLSAIANTGVKSFTFKDVALEKLAESVARLVAENNYFKKRAPTPEATDVELLEDVFTVSFGPEKSYFLSVSGGAFLQRKSRETGFRILASSSGVFEEDVDKQLNLF